jgi:hypothetical protein
MATVDVTWTTNEQVFAVTILFIWLIWYKFPHDHDHLACVPAILKNLPFFIFCVDKSHQV